MTAGDAVAVVAWFCLLGVGYAVGRTRPVLRARDGARWRLTVGPWPNNPMRFRLVGVWTIIVLADEFAPILWRRIMRRPAPQRRVSERPLKVRQP